MSRCESSFRFRFPPSYKGRPGGFVAAPAFLQRQWIRIKKRVQGLSRDGRRRRRRRRRELERARLTPTWAVAVVCAVIVVISILLEKVLHRFGEWLTEKHKKALFEALEKMFYLFFCMHKQLMILGFISLLLTFGQKYIVKICIPYKVADTMLPCSRKTDTGMEEEADGGHRRRLLTNALADRNVSRGKGATYFNEWTSSIAHLNFLLGRVSRCKQRHCNGPLEDSTMRLIELREDGSIGKARLHHLSMNSPRVHPSRFRYTHETSFVRRHTSIWNRLTICFYFITWLCAMVLSLPALWASALIILLLDVHGWKEKFWASMIPLVVRSRF
ncbi:hypothetical protein MUK42_07517 [Musa troglodytarum]|uniref:MLO-like protein n=1 Tax=Musa troglodytarum TaxID=320322 RepID=A0A9E7JJA9_9LILI|nr:hypothetical protein MUK42_07517 [Musa troglodytarum]